MQHLLNKVPALALLLFITLIASAEASAQATIVILNGDAAGVGFNDTTPATPVGGNNGTTIGQQRLNAFQAAANIWGSSLVSGPTIVIRGTWPELACTATSGTLGSAGNNSNLYRNFSGSESDFWYGNALANALSGIDRNGASHEINAQFNVKLGKPGCLENAFWYYGLDNNHGANGIDLVSVLLHEFAHGLGFATFTNRSTGVQIGSDMQGQGGFPSIYDRYLFDNTTGKSWPQMTNAERVASAINTGNLVWNGPQVVNDVPGVLSGTPRLRVNLPVGIAGNYQVGTASFGPALSPAGTTGDVVYTTPNDGCTAISNSIAGKIALIDRGNCNFVVKTKNAQIAGATAVIIADNGTAPPTPPLMGGTDPTITIPTVSITQANGNTIKAQLPANATLFADTSMIAGTDSARRPFMYAPNPLEGGSSVSHWDNSLLPNQLMEPNIAGDLSHAVSPPLDLTLSLFKDIGWPTGTPPPPPPPPPANDNFASAQAISGCSGTVTGTNVSATKEAGEPAHFATSPGSMKSVWYQWQAVASQSVTIDTIGSNFDTILAIYTGNSVNGLTLVTNNDDIASGNTASTVTFPATQGIIYRIAVDGFNNGNSGGDPGSIVLNWNQTNCAVVGPTIFVEQGTNVLAAVDSVTQVKGPFTVLTPNSFNQDGKRRIIFFTTDLGLPAGNTTGLVVRANTTSLPVETAGPFTLINGSYVIIRLDNLTPGPYNLTVELNGAISTNAPTIQIIP